MTARKPFILLADDDEDDHYSLQLAFAEVGYEQRLAFVFSGREVMDLLQELLPEELPTLIVLDINIPGMDGIARGSCNITDNGPLLAHQCIQQG